MPWADQQSASNTNRPVDTYDFLADPRALSLADRKAARSQFDREQHRWLSRLRQLAEGPEPADDFPAFLLATAPFADFARRLGHSASRPQLGTEVQDELDWFLRAFVAYLRTDEGEDVFANEDARCDSRQPG